MTIPEHHYLIDFTAIDFNPLKIDRQKLRYLYLERRLSSNQIAQRMGLSKQAILSRLRKEGIQKTKNKGRDPQNYQYPYAPYGHRVYEGCLTINRREMKIARLIVELRDRKKVNWNRISNSLNEKGYRSRTGLLWNIILVKRIHKYWTGKI